MLERAEWDAMSMEEKQLHADVQRFVGVVRDMMNYVTEESAFAEFDTKWSYRVPADYSFHAVMRVDVGNGVEEVELVVPGNEWMSGGDLELGYDRVDDFGRALDPAIYE